MRGFDDLVYEIRMSQAALFNAYIATRSYLVSVKDIANRAVTAAINGVEKS